jgi:hypothetical protein
MNADHHNEAYAAVKAARSPEYNRRCAVHEASHAVLGRAMGSFIELVTIVPSGSYAGRCVRRGAPSAAQASLNLLDEQKVKDNSPAAPTTADLVAVCAHIGAPEVGTPRVDLAEEITRAQTFMIELVAGSVGERVMFPDMPQLPAEHDRAEARALASVVCAMPSAIDALLAYAEAEAEALIRANLDIVEALADALVAKGTLSGGAEVDEVIATCVARRALAKERERRRRWQAICISAGAFKPE